MSPLHWITYFISYAIDLPESKISLDQNIVVPDLAGWKQERFPVEEPHNWISIAPDWLCEILSPSNASNDTVKKKRVYHRHGVSHYWIIDPMNETLTVYRWTEEAYLEILTAARGECVRAEPFDAVEMHVGVFFGDDEE